MGINEKIANGAWPLVDKNDDGIRLAGGPDKCFYCNQKVGMPHGKECVVVTKRVYVTYIFKVGIDVPYSWDKQTIEFNRNKSSWCANNALFDIERHLENFKGACLCHGFKCEYQGVLDKTLRREIVKAENK